MVAHEILVRIDAICTHADDLDAQIGKILIAVTKGASLFGAAIGFVFGIKIEHNRLGFQYLGQALWPTVLVEQREVGGGGVDGWSGHFLGVARYAFGMVTSRH